MTAHLVACPACARHVRASEAVCPFCASAVPDAMRASTPRRPPTERLSRAAMYAFGVGGLAVAAACCSSSTKTPDDSGAGHDAEVYDALSAAHYGGTPLYGAPGQPLPDAGDQGDATGAADAGIDSPMGQAAYGGFIPLDASSGTGSGSGS